MIEDLTQGRLKKLSAFGSTLQEGLNFLNSMNPFGAAYEAATGKDASGDSLSGWQRAMSAAATMATPIATVAKSGAKIIKQADEVVDAAKNIAATTGKNVPKPSPKFQTPTNPPSMPPTNVPAGYNLRVMKPTEQYPNGYWVLEKPMPQGGFQKVDPRTMKPGPHWDTHIPLPGKPGD